MRRALIIRLEEIGKISPQAVLEATSGELFQLLVYTFAGGSKKEPPPWPSGSSAICGWCSRV